MSVGQQDDIDGRRIHGKRAPVSEPQRLEPLE